LSCLLPSFPEWDRRPTDPENNPPRIRQYECVRAVLDKASNLKLLLLEFSPVDHGSEHKASLARARAMGEVDGTLTGWRRASVVKEYLVFASEKCPPRRLLLSELQRGPNPFFFADCGLSI
jgi:hypothetical protein